MLRPTYTVLKGLEVVELIAEQAATNFAGDDRSYFQKLQSIARKLRWKLSSLMWRVSRSDLRYCHILNPGEFKVSIVEEAGSVVLVKSEGGVTAYVVADAISQQEKPLMRLSPDRLPNHLRVYDNRQPGSELPLTQFRAVRLQPFRRRVGIETPECVSFDFQLRLSDAT